MISSRLVTFHLVLKSSSTAGWAAAMKAALSTSIFVMPPSIKVLEERLRRRGTESEEHIQRRLKNATEEIRHSRDYDYLVVNDDLAAATARMIEIIRTERGMNVRRET